MSDDCGKHLTRRELLERLTTGLLVTAIATPLAGTIAKQFPLTARLDHVDAVNAVAGVDRVVMKHGKTYLNAWTGYGAPPRAGRPARGAAAAPAGPVPKTTWSKESGPGIVTFADPTSPTTTATFSSTGD